MGGYPMAWVFVLLFFAIVFAISYLHWRVNNSFKIEPTWVALATMPPVLWLVLSGQITELVLPGGLAIKTAALESVSLSSDGEKVSPDKIESGGKGPGNLGELKRRGTAALWFTLGSGYYEDGAILEYLVELDRLQLLLYTDEDRRYVGASQVAPIMRMLDTGELPLARLIQEGATDQIPTFHTASIALEATRAEALRIMDREGLAYVPVVDGSDRFVGVLERDKLTSSIVADLVARQANAE